METNELEDDQIQYKARLLGEVLKSPVDTKREYRALELSNELKVILVSDPATDKAAAALNVMVGSMSDPEHLPGLAHYLEHMLFLGTEKYPEENSYAKYLSENAGSSNAYTGNKINNGHNNRRVRHAYYLHTYLIFTS